MVKVFVSGTKDPHPSAVLSREKKFVSIPSLLAPLLHMTCGARGAADDKDLAVSCDHNST